jgi:hypothetical protein
MGSLDELPGGTVLVGWGAQPDFSEYTASGKLILNARLPGPDLSYRATAAESWVGQPLSPPSGAARRSGGATTVYASWNGATQVARWRVLGGTSRAALSRVASAARSGFETAVKVPVGSRVFEVQALDSAGKVIGTSKIFGVSS